MHVNNHRYSHPSQSYNVRKKVSTNERKLFLIQNDGFIVLFSSEQNFPAKTLNEIGEICYRSNKMIIKKNFLLQE